MNQVVRNVRIGPADDTQSPTSGSGQLPTSVVSNGSLPFRSDGWCKDESVQTLRFEAAVSRALAEMVFDTLPVAVVDRHGVLMWVNRHGAKLLETLDLVAGEPSRLTIPDDEGARRFDSLLHSGEGNGHLVFRRRVDGEWIVVRSSRCRIEEQDVHILRFAFSAMPADCRANGLADQFGLTRTEGKVLDRFAQLYSIEDIAQEMGIQAATVRSHLKRIYAKTGVHSGRELVRLVAAFAVI